MQVKEDLTFLDIGGLFLLYVQGNVPQEGDKSPTKMQKLIKKAMEQMRK
jgi:hypothetical protein